MFITLCAYFYLKNFEFNLASTANTYFTTAIVSSLVTCGLACLAKPKIQKFAYLYGMTPGLFGLLGFELFYHTSKDIDVVTKRPLEYKYLGTSTTDSNLLTSITGTYLLSHENLRNGLTGLVILGAIVDIFMLRIWLSGKLTGSCIAFLAGASQGKLNRVLSDYQGIEVSEAYRNKNLLVRTKVIEA